ncbi:uncharacterized protein LOC135707613 [Ochlerotatus camptorhynchus]|uniref:uncharacterized protein LOC135707613 n=1 Tax=Ochlerotatus camptorhynchus TaxID=644619 RepID=UPI0031E12FAD
MEVVIEEQALLQDFLNQVPADCLTFLNGIGYNTTGLLTVTETYFKTSLEPFPNFWGADQLWHWILDWRRRNHLDNLILPEQQPEGEIPLEEEEVQQADGADKENSSEQNSSPLKIQYDAHGSGEGSSSANSEANNNEISGIKKAKNPTGSLAESKFHYLTPNVLKHLLAESVFGNQVLKCAEIQQLSPAGKKFVVDTVARYHLTQDRKTSAEVLNEYSDVIVTLFVKEGKLDIDYRLLAFGDSNKIVKNWVACFECISKFAQIQAKDPSAKDLIRAIDDLSLSADSRLLNVLLVLNTVLLPVKASKGFKPTVATAQSDTFVVAPNREEALIAVQKLYDVYDKQEFPLCPKLAIIGENSCKIQGGCMVVYKSLVYDFSSVARAIDVIIKLHLVLGLPFSKTSKLVWVFIEKYLYGIETDRGYLCINKLISYIQEHNPRCL